MNLSHYLFYDDGIYNGLNLGDFRTRLCDHLGDHLNKKSDDKYRGNLVYRSNWKKGNCLNLVPIVTIVIEGGDSTIENIYNDLRANIPIVIIDVRWENRRNRNNYLSMIYLNRVVDV